MGRLVVSEFVSLDGVFEAPGPGEPFEHAGWEFLFDGGEDGRRFKFEEVMAADAQLLGRVTYEGFARSWPTMEGTGAFGQKMNSMPKYVMSSTLRVAEWKNSTILHGPLEREIPELKSRHAGDILVAGSGRLVRGLLAAGLVDELRLVISPIVLGSGKRLFAEGTPTIRLSLIEQLRVGPDGVTIMRYAL